MTSATREKRKFRIDANAIMLLCGGQSGSLQKALLEGVANSQDAGADEVAITLSPRKVSIQDNGKGFASKDEINDFFDNFCFDHSKSERGVGRFGMGRGQLFSFGKNRWTTNDFIMEVDIESHGLDYDLVLPDKPSPGMKIEIELYKPLTSSELLAVERELKKLVLYCHTPLTINGKRVTKDPAKEEWTIETDDAWIRTTPGHELAIYSQGLFVQNIYSYEFGCGGTVITKPGRALQQNMARNDIVRDKCPVWKRVQKEVRKASSKNREQAISGKAKVTDGMRASLATDAMGEPSLEALQAFAAAPLITLTNGKNIRIDKMAQYGAVTVGPMNSPVGDRLIQCEQACVIIQATLDRFNAEDPAALLLMLKNQAKVLDKWTQDNRLWGKQYPSLWRHTSMLATAKGYENIAALPMAPSSAFEVVKAKDWTATEKLAMRALRQNGMAPIHDVVRKHLERNGKTLVLGEGSYGRSVDLMDSEVANACTDGSTHIWIDRKFLNQCVKNGAPGYHSLCHVMAHELLHNSDSSSGHEHDHEFFESFHDICLEGEVARTALLVYRSFLALGGKASPNNIKLMESVGEQDADAATVRFDAIQEAEQELLAASAAPKARSRRLKA